MFLPKYRFDLDKNIWVWKGKENPGRMWLDEIYYKSGEMKMRNSDSQLFEVVDSSQIKSLDEYK